MNLKEFLSRFDSHEKKGENYMVRCPGHEDKRASLGVKLGDDGKTIMLNCFANCSSQTIVEAMGLGLKDLFGDHPKKKEKGVISKTYDYHDIDGNVVCQAVRMIPKDFKQRKPNGKGGWIWGTKGVDKPPYRLVELLESEGVVYIVEGEKDADNLADLGFCATTNVGGAGKWKESFNEYLKDRDVVLLPDNDDPGRDHANRVAQSLLNIAKSVKVVKLSVKEKGDVSDWLESNSGFDLEELVNCAPDYVKEDSLSFKLFNMSSDPPMPVKWLIESLIPWNSKVIIGAEQKTGKTFLTFYFAICIVTGKSAFNSKVQATGDVIIYSAEGEGNLKQRLYGLCVWLDVDFDFVVKHIHFVDDKPVDFKSDVNVSTMISFVKKFKVKMVIVDPLVAATVGLDENKSDEIMGLLLKLQRITDETDCCLLICHHRNKGKEVSSKGHKLRGTSAIAGWYDALIEVERDNENENETIRKMGFQFRDGGDRKCIYWQFFAEPLPLGIQESLRALKFYNDESAILELRRYSIITVEQPKTEKITCRLDPGRIVKIIMCIYHNPGVLLRAAVAHQVGLGKSTASSYFNYLLDNKTISLDENGWLNLV